MLGLLMYISFRRNLGPNKAFDVGAFAAKASKAEPNKKVTKKNRVWDEATTPETKLDFTDHLGADGDTNIDFVATDQGESMMDKEEIVSSESEDEEDDATGKNSKPDAKSKGWFSSMFQR